MQFINLILYKNVVLERYFQSKWCIKIHRDAEHWNNARSFLFLASNKVSQPPELSCPHFSVPGLYKFKVRRNLCFIKNVNQKQQTNVNISCKHKHAFNTTMLIFFQSYGAHENGKINTTVSNIFIWHVCISTYNL